MPASIPLLPAPIALIIAALTPACGSSQAAPQIAAAGAGTAQGPVSVLAGAAAQAGSARPNAAGAVAGTSGTAAISSNRPPGSAAAATSGGPGSPQLGAAGVSAQPGAAGDHAQPGAAGSAAGNTAASAGAAAGTPAANSGSCPGSLCDSFEDMPGPMLGGTWELATTNCTGTGMVSVDTSQAHSGTHSIKVQGAGGYCNHVFFRPKALMLAPSTPVYARFFVRLDKALTQSHVTLLAMRDEHEMKDLRMGGQSEILMWNRESDDATLPELSPTGIGMSVKPEVGKWLCVELGVDPKAASLQTWVDGKAVAGLTVEGDATPDVDAQWKRKADWSPDLRDLRLGWESYGGDANTLWFDDVAVGGARLGCGS
jgi:hypothetical protein